MRTDDLARLVESAKADEKRAEEAFALLSQALELIKQASDLLPHRRAGRAPSARKSGGGVTTKKALEYASAVRKASPEVAREDLERRVLELARKDGFSTSGVVTRLRKALCEET